MAPGANIPSSKSGTGTVPKSKTRNNPVPREMVAPTRRDMQMNSATSMDNYDWRIESENSGGNITERSGGPASQSNSNNYSTFFDIFGDLDTTASHDNNRFVPVRPQPRSLGLSQQEDEAFHNNFHSNSPSNMAANTAIVMPTTPGTTSRTRETTPSYRRSADRSCVVFNSVPSQNDGQNIQNEPTNMSSSSQTNNTAKSNNIVSQSHDRQMLEQKLHQIREYLKVTSSLMQSVGDENQMVTEEDVDMLRLINDLKDSEAKLLRQLNNFNDDLALTENNSNNSNREEFQEMGRASPSLSQTSQSSYNTLSTKLLPQQTINQNMCNDRSKVDRKNKKQFKNSSQKSGNNQQQHQQQQQQQNDNTQHLNTLCDEMLNLQFTSNNHENIDQDTIKRVSELNECQADLKSLFESFKNNTNDDHRTDHSQGGSVSAGSSHDVTPIANENAAALDVTVNQLKERLQKLRTLSGEQNHFDVYQQFENIKVLRERIAKLQQRTEEREELNRLLNERDEHLTADHHALHEKLRDLHHKKELVEKLVNDLQNLACGPPIQETSLASMRSQLATFQAMLDNVVRTENELNTNSSNQQQQPSETSNIASSGSNCNVTKYDRDRSRNRNVYHPIDFPIENRDSLDEEEDLARGGGRFDKKINKSAAPTIGPFQRQQMILKAELQAKKRELEELMRKDQDCTSTINQDVCSVASIDKSSDISRFVVQEDGFLGRSAIVNQTDYSSDEDEEVDGNNEPTNVRYQMNSNNNNNHQLNNHSVLPSTSTIVSNSGVQTNKKKRPKQQSVTSPMLSNHEITDLSGCSTPEPSSNTIWRKPSQAGSNGHHQHLNNIKKSHGHHEQGHNLPMNISSHDIANMPICEPLTNTIWRKPSQTSSIGHHQHLNNIKKTHGHHEQCHNLPMDITSHDIANMSICSSIENMPPPMTPIWTKPTSTNSLHSRHEGGIGTIPPSKIPSTISPKQQSVYNSPWFYPNIAVGGGIQQRPDVIVGNGMNTIYSDGIPTSSSASNCRQGSVQPPQGSREWWQKKALQLQQQLELTSNLCQSIITDQQGGPSSQSPASSIQNDTNIYPPSYAPIPIINSSASSFVPVRAISQQQPVVGPIGMQPMLNNGADIQNLVATNQLHFQSMLLTTINHCYQMLWMQQKELSMLRSMIVTLQENNMVSREPLLLNGINSQTQFQNSTSRMNQQKLYPNNSGSTIIGPHSGNSENILPTFSNYSNPTSQNTNTLNNFNHQNCLQPQQNNNTISQQNLSSNFNYANSSSQTVIQNAASLSPNVTNTVQAVAQSNNIIPPLQFDNQRPQCVQNISQSSQAQQPQVNWNGAQALNNQVAPGNRANNYWDNFRSYSRQNLLSTTTSKSNEGSSHSPSPLIDRSHNMFRTNGIIAPMETLNHHISLPKSNTNNASSSSAQDDLVIKRQKKRQHSDVSINVNQCHDTNIASGNNNQIHSNNHQSAHYSLDGQASSSTAATMHTHLLNIIQQNLSNPDNNSDSPSNLEQRLNEPINSEQPSCSSHSSDKASKHESTQRRNIYDPNEWRENPQNDRSKPKLFDFLRDNVYKEVASLISANENRPHFLIQLFRDLQLISSDGLRHRTLQSIQGVVTDSLANLPVNGQGANRQNNSPTVKKENSQSSDQNNEEFMKEKYIELQNLITAQGDVNKIRGDEKFELEVHSVIYNLVPFFHVNADNICSDLMTETIRTLALQLIPTLPFLSENTVKSKYYFEYCQTQLNSYLERTLMKFHGCRLRNVTEEILSVITDIVVGELYILYASDVSLISSHDCTTTTNGELISNESTVTEQSSHSYPEQGSPSESQDADSSDHQQHHHHQCSSNSNQNGSASKQEYNSGGSLHQQDTIQNDCQPSLLHNGDLAEADQSHDNEEEEGAVGGLLNPDDGIALIKSEDVSSEDTGGGNTEADLEWITFDSGLDCSAPNNTASTENLIVSTDKPPGGDPTCD